MDLHLADKIVMVAGSSRGIGLATARAFLAEGCRVIVTGRETDSLTRARTVLESESDSDRILACEGDLGQAAVVKRVVSSIRERWGHLDCLVANIGNGRGTPGWDLEESDWTDLFERNLWVNLRLIREVLPAMTRAGRGSIVLTASVVGLESMSAPLPYSAAKAALINYSKNLARQMAQHNVRVNCVAPGNILFPGGSWDKHLAERRDEVLKYINSEVPMQRFGRPGEIADLIVFLSSERASFVTGACIVADGGQTRGL